MLAPGAYVAKSMVGVRVGSTDSFTIAAAQTTPLSLPLGFGAEMMTIQTLATKDLRDSDFKNTVDPEIHFMVEGEEPVYFDDVVYDVLVIPMPEAGTHHIRITDWAASRPDYIAGGEYVLYVTKGSMWTPENPQDWVTDGRAEYPVAPGTFSSPTGGIKFTPQPTSVASAPAIEMNTLHYACFAGPAYSNADATSGITGHFYKLVLEDE
jgi:hypothetical protein